MRKVLFAFIFTLTISAFVFAQDSQRGLQNVAKENAEIQIESKTQPKLHFLEGYGFYRMRLKLLAFSPNGKYILLVSGNKKLSLLDLEKGYELWSFSSDFLDIALSHDGKRIAISISDMIKILNFDDAKELLSINTKTGGMLTWSPNDLQIAEGTSNSSIKFWDSNTGTELKEIKTAEKYVYPLKWSSNTNQITCYLTSDDIYDKSYIKVYDLKNNKESLTIEIKSPFHWCFNQKQKTKNEIIALSGECSSSNYNCNGISIFSEISGTLKHYLLKDDVCSDIDYSPNGNFLAIAHANEIDLFDVKTGEKIRAIKIETIPSTIVWNPDGNTIAISDIYGIKIYDIKTGKKIKSIDSINDSVSTVKFSPDGKYLSFSCIGNKDIKIFKSENGCEIKKLSADHFTVGTDFSWSPDSINIISCDSFRNAKLWNANSKQFSYLNDTPHYFENSEWSPNGETIALVTDNELFLIDTTTSKIQKIEDENRISAITWSSNSGLLAYGNRDNNKIVILQRNNGFNKATSTEYHYNRLSWTESLTFSANDKYIIGGGPGGIEKISIEEKQTLIGISTDSVISSNIGHSPNREHILIGNINGNLEIYDSLTLKNIKILKGHTDGVTNIDWSSNGKLICSGSLDGTIKVWNANTYELIYTIINGKDGEYLTYTPEGFFTGTEWACKNLVYIVDGLEVTELNQLYDKLHRPDLIAAKARGEDISEEAAKVNLAALLNTGKSPVVAFRDVPKTSDSRDLSFEFSVKDSGGGIGAVSIVLNGKVIKLSDGIKSSNGETKIIRHTVTLQDGENKLQAFAYNSAGVIESLRAETTVTWHGKTEKPNLYVLSLGINKYRDGSLRLNYAVPDALSVADGFKKQQSGLYENVFVDSLIDVEVTRNSIATEFKKLSEQVTADDIFILYLSGHGTTYDDGDYYYLPVDFRYTNKDDIPKSAISKKDLVENLSMIKAGKTLVMLDTCNSGAFLDSAKRGIAEKTAIDRLTRATGHATLVASTDSQSAMEGYNGHGVFTYVLLDGLQGKADSDNDGYVSLSELASYIENEVPERSYEKWGYEQVPQKDLRKQDFPIAQNR